MDSSLYITLQRITKYWKTIRVYLLVKNINISAENVLHLMREDTHTHTYVMVNQHSYCHQISERDTSKNHSFIDSFRADSLETFSCGTGGLLEREKQSGESSSQFGH